MFVTVNRNQFSKMDKGKPWKKERRGKKEVEDKGCEESKTKATDTILEIISLVIYFMNWRIYTKGNF